jgi:hypothetical protein
MEKENAKEKKIYKATSVYMRLNKEAYRKIQHELANLNKKAWGKTITPDQFVTLAITLIQDIHRKQLQDDSLSNKDRLEQKYSEYCRSVSRVTRDEFVGLLLSGQISQT